MSESSATGRWGRSTRAVPRGFSCQEGSTIITSLSGNSGPSPAREQADRPDPSVPGNPGPHHHAPCSGPPSRASAPDRARPAGRTGRPMPLSAPGRCAVAARCSASAWPALGRAALGPAERCHSCFPRVVSCPSQSKTTTSGQGGMSPVLNSLGRGPFNPPLQMVNVSPSTL